LWNHLDAKGASQKNITSNQASDKLLQKKKGHYFASEFLKLANDNTQLVAAPISKNDDESAFLESIFDLLSGLAFEPAFF